MALFTKKQTKPAAKPVLQGMDEETKAISRQLLQKQSENPNLQEQLDVDVNLEIKRVEKNTREQRVRFIKNRCDIISESLAQSADAKREYEEVTEYLMDIDKIENISGEDEETIYSCAANIKRLTEERAKYRSGSIKISEEQIRIFEPYESKLGRDVKKMYADEAFQMALKSDMGHLEGEKHTLLHEQKELEAKQKYLKSLTAILIVLLVSVFALFFVIQEFMKIDMILPYMLTIAFAAILATVIFLQGLNNKRETLLNEAKINKAIVLLNRVKIKFINNTNVLDYTYAKYGVESAVQFEFLFGEYVKAKEYSEKFRDNTEQLHFNNELLIDTLKKYGIHDSEVWIHQVSAILDKRDMVEVRHRLNIRRQKIRERMEYNSMNKDHAYEELHVFMQKYPEAKSDVAYVLKKYNLVD